MASKGKGREVNISLAIQRSAMSGKNKEIAAFYNLDTVPDDIWLFLFEYLTTPDLNSMSQVSKKFYALTQRPLLRELTWAKATGASRNVQDWADGGPLEAFRGVVRKVNIKLSYKKVNQNSALLLPVDWELYDSIHHRLLSFTNLRALDLQNTIVTPALYQVLEGIPSLRELSIVRCVFMWTYIYFPLLTNLGRQAPSPGLFVYNPNSRTYSHQHGLSRAPADPAQRAIQQQWLIENASFDFATRLSHITSLTLRFNRFYHSQSETDDSPYGPTEINRPCILHPLYLLSIPSLTHLTLNWTPTLAQIYETLRQQLIVGGQQNNNGGNGAVAALQQQHQLASLLFAANSLGVNLFTPLVTGLLHLVHATVIIDDLGRDIMDSITSLFQQRIQNAPPGMAPLRIHLKVGKHTLTEQNMGNSQFRLPGVYRYEGPLPIASLLAQDSATDMEEVYMNEPMEMNLILIVLEKLPRTLKKLHLRMYAWDREILYAAHSLFKHLTEFEVRFGKGSLEENTFVVLGSDILPDLKQLHTIRLIYSPDCIKREQQFRSYHTPPTHPHNHHLQFHGGTNWWHGGPPGGGGHGGGGLGGQGGLGGGPGHGTFPPYHPPAPGPTHSLPPPPPPPPVPGPPDLIDLTPDSPSPPPQSHVLDLMQDDFYDYDEEDGVEMLTDLILDNYRRNRLATLGAGPAATSAGSSSSAASGSGTGIASGSGASTSATDPTPAVSAGDNTEVTTVANRHFENGTNLLRSMLPPGHPSRNAPATTGAVRGHHLYQHRRTRFSSGDWSDASSPDSSPSAGTTNTVEVNGLNSNGHTSANTHSHSRNSITSLFPRFRRDRERERPLTINEPPRRELPAGASSPEERVRIAQTLEEDLGDYLVGWNRHCRSLRVVQMEPGVVWVRRYEGDVWAKKKT